MIVSEKDGSKRRGTVGKVGFEKSTDKKRNLKERSSKVNDEDGEQAEKFDFNVNITIDSSKKMKFDLEFENPKLISK